MKFISTIILLIFFCSGFISAQNNRDNIPQSDSTKTSKENLNTELNSLNSADVLFFNKPDFLGHTNWIYLSAKLNQNQSVRTPLSDIALAKKELHNVLNIQYQKIVDSQLGVWGQILGMAQAAAVGVLAYEHIRKYYFKKK